MLCHQHPFVRFERVSALARNAHDSVEDTGTSDERLLNISVADVGYGSPAVSDGRVK